MVTSAARHHAENVITMFWELAARSAVRQATRCTAAARSSVWPANSGQETTLAERSAALNWPCHLTEVISVQMDRTSIPAASFSAHQGTRFGETTVPPAKAAERGAEATVCVWMWIPQLLSVLI